jgi:hypothetical protein
MTTAGRRNGAHWLVSRRRRRESAPEANAPSADSEEELVTWSDPLADH